MAGGASSRMGSDKAGLRFLLSEKNFVERAVAALSAIATQNLYIVGNVEQNFADLRVLPDVVEKLQHASIIGLHTALFHSKARWAAILACDLPFVTGEVFERLVFFSKSENSEVVVPIQPDGRAQPLCALYKPSFCLPIIEKMIDENVWSLQKLFRQMKTRFVEFSELSDLPNSEYFFFNVNTPEEYDRAQQIENSIKS